MKAKTRKQPDFMVVGEKDLEAIMSRVEACSLAEEDRHVIVAILKSWSWLHRQLGAAKLGMRRLKQLFGFVTEKRKTPQTGETAGDGVDDVGAEGDSGATPGEAGGKKPKILTGIPM